MIKEKLKILGFNEKEIQVYLYLVEYGTSAASEISQHISLPKSSVNFLADNLWKRGMLLKSFRGKTGYYEADISSLKKSIGDEILNKSQALNDILPVLEEKNKNVISKPKISFIDGLENCKKEYLQLLEVGKFYEFGAHEDLEGAFGKEFMESFISMRIKKGVFCDSVGTDGKVELDLQQLDASQERDLKIFSRKEFGEIGSSIAIYNNKVLILNLKGLYTGVLIENKEFSQSMKTIFLICKRDNS